MAKGEELRETVAISKGNRDLITDFQEKDILGFKMASTTDIFTTAMALGIQNPTPLTRRDPYTRTSYFTTKDMAIFEAPALALTSSDEEVNEKANLEACLDLCEQCAEAGFKKLHDEIEAANWDKEIFERRILKQLDMLYTQYVENDI